MSQSQVPSDGDTWICPICGAGPTSPHDDGELADHFMAHGLGTWNAGWDCVCGERFSTVPVGSGRIESGQIHQIDQMWYDHLRDDYAHHRALATLIVRDKP